MKVTEEYNTQHWIYIIYNFNDLFTEVYDPHSGNLTRMNNPISCKYSEGEMQD